MSIKSKIAAAVAVLAIAGTAATPAALASAPATSASAASTSAPVPFPVYDNGSSLVTGHPVKSEQRLVVDGRPLTLGSVAKHGPAYIVQVKGVLLATWKNRTLTAVAEG